MRWSEPSRTEARIWLTKFNESYMALASSAFTDDTAASSAVEALTFLLEREPERSGLVSGLLVALIFQARSSLPPERVLAAADLGLRAERMRSDTDPERPLQRALLASARAEAHLGRHEQFQALEQAASAAAALDSATHLPTLRTYLRGHAAAMEAEAWDALLEPTRALARHQAADEAFSVFIGDEQRLAALLAELVPFLHGDSGASSTEVARATLRNVWFELGSAHVRSAVGIARCQALLGSQEATAATRRAAQVIGAVGPGPVAPLDLVPLLRLVDTAAARAVLESVEGQAEALGLDRDAYRAVLGAAASASAAERGEDPSELLGEASAARRMLQDDLLIAASLGLTMVAESWGGEPSPEPVGEAREVLAFVGRLERLEDARDERLRDLRVRSIFDEPLALTTDVLARRFAAAYDRETRIRLARVLESLGAGRRPFDVLAGSVAGVSTIAAREAAHDLLGRLEASLESWREAGAVVVRALRDDTLFVCVSGAGTSLMRAGPSYRRAAEALTSRLGVELKELDLVGTPSPESVFEKLGRDAFEALPTSVREFLDAHDVILICPDFRSGADAVPFELFHDGSGWLGVAKVVARFPTLSALTRSAEGTTRRDPHQRALALAVPEAEGFDDLRFAADEAARVRRDLAAAGWDVPVTDPVHASPTYVMERLPFAAHVHVAAHGEATGHDEAVVLAGEARLRSEDLLARFFPRLPTVYLNTCSLASTRYVGGGISRGVAQALVERGAAAVIANLLPVDDAASSELATLFYESKEDFGGALRAARSELSERGVSPLLWSTTVLIGDPRTTLTPGRPPQTLAEELLDTYFARPEERDPAIVMAAERALAGERADPRLEAAVGLLQDVASWPAEPTPDDRPRMEAAMRLALELDHVPAAAMLAFFIIRTIDDDREPDLATAAIEEGLSLVEPLEHEGEVWGRILDELLVRWIQLRRGHRRLEVDVTGGGDEGDRDEALRVGQAVFDTQLALEARAMRRGDAPRPREERTMADVCWNAVLASRELGLEDMPARFAFSRQVAERLARLDAFPEVSIPFAATAVAGLLPWLWDRQHAADFPSEMAEGQARTLGELVASLATHWPPREAAWFETVRLFPDEITASLATMDDLPYSEELYTAMGEVIDGIEGRANALLEEVHARFPERLPDAAAWILGSLVEKNTYSWTAGSVPEAISERLSAVHDRVGGRGEGLFMPWLMEGFRSVRERELNELDRWKYGIAR